MAQICATGDMYGIDPSLPDSTIFVAFGSENDWAQIAHGENHIIGLKTDGTLWCLGHNNEGQIGLGVVASVAIWTQIGSDTDWVYVACGDMHSLCIKSNGTLHVCGHNSNGELGLGDRVKRTIFTQVGSVTTWSKVSSMSNHTLALRTDGTLWATGNNYYGKLGLGDWVRRESFVQVGSATNWTVIWATDGSSHVINSLGEKYGCGYNYGYQLSIGTTGAEDTLAQETSYATDWVDVAGWETYCVAVKANGTVYGTGREYDECMGGSGHLSGFTQLAMPTTMASVQISGHSTYILTTDGVLYVAGDNYDNPLGLANTSDVTPFTIVPSYASNSILATQKTSFSAVRAFFVKGVTAYGQHRSICGGIRFGNKEIIGSRINGTLYQLSPDVYKDNTDNIKRIRRSQIVSDDDRYIIHNLLELEFEPGVGLSGEDAPTVTLKWSDDGGHNWSEGRELSIGEYEEYAKRTVWRRLGKSRDRIYEVSTLADVKIVLIDAYTDVTLTQGRG